MSVRIGLAIAAVATMVCSTASAQNGRFTSVNPDEAIPTRLPPGLDTTPITVVVILAGDPVSTVQESVGRKLSREEKDGIKRQRISEQNAVVSQIQAAGGRIVGAFQSAVNGIKVQIPSSNAGALKQIPGVVDVKGVNTYERNNVLGVPRVQAPAVWSGIPGFRG